jgi:hypothetical protein
LLEDFMDQRGLKPRGPGDHRDGILLTIGPALQARLTFHVMPGMK